MIVWKNIKLAGIFATSLLLLSCGKDWLDVKPDKGQTVPYKVIDFQSLLDNSALFNAGQSVGLGEIGSGDFYTTFTIWQSLINVQEKSAYIWADTENFYLGEFSFDWAKGFERILTANIILEGIEKVKPEASNQQDWNQVKGSALFFRAFDFFNLAQEYCKPYNPATANSDLGLPLRLQYDVNIKLQRSSLQQTYDRVIADLMAAVDLLGTKPQFKTRPSKEAVYALLARVYLSQNNYEQARLFADKALQIQSELLDYSKLNSSASFPLARFNTEVIFHSIFSFSALIPARMIIDPALYDSYVENDARKTLFFTKGTNGITYKGSYNADRNMFGGLATDELYLVRAEAEARSGQLERALADLNLLRRNRWKGVYTDLQSSDAEDVLRYILQERRKELLFRGQRWQDLRRLNQDSRFAVTLMRTLNGTIYTLAPNDKKYVLPVDENEIRLSGIAQNERK